MTLIGTASGIRIAPYKTDIVTPAAASAKGLTTKETVKAELGITGGGFDDRIGRWILAQSQAIAGYCDRDFPEEGLRDSFRIDRERRPVEALMLSRWPVSTIAAVVEDGVTLAASQYELNAETGELWRLDGNDCRRYWCGGLITVEFTGGYSLPADAPADLQGACIDLAKLSYFGAGRDPKTRAEDIPGIISQQFWVDGPDQDAWPKAVTQTLDRYAKITV